MFGPSHDLGLVIDDRPHCHLVFTRHRRFHDDDVRNLLEINGNDFPVNPIDAPFGPIDRGRLVHQQSEADRREDGPPAPLPSPSHIIPHRQDIAACGTVTGQAGPVKFRSLCID